MLNRYQMYALKLSRALCNTRGAQVFTSTKIVRRIKEAVVFMEKQVGEYYIANKVLTFSEYRDIAWEYYLRGIHKDGMNSWGSSQATRACQFVNELLEIEAKDE